MITTIKQAWKNYLVRNKLEDLKKTDREYIERRKTFYAGFGSCLVVQLDEIAELEEEQACNELEKWINELEVFWNRELIRFDNLN